MYRKRPAIALRAAGGGPHEPEGERDLVPEVDAAVGRQERLVGAVGPGELGLAPRLLAGGLGDLAARRVGVRAVPGCGIGQCRGLDRHPVGVGEVVGRRDVLVLAAAEQRRQRSEEAGRIAERPVRVEVELEQVLAQEDDDLRPAQDAQVGRQAELERVFADEPVAKGVKGRDRGVGVAVRDELVDTDRHLVGGLVGEGQGQDLRRLGPMGRDEPGDPPGDDLGLPGAGAGDDEQRPVPVRDRPELVGVEATEQRLEPRRRRARDRRIHDRHEVTPGRQLVERDRLAAPTRPRAHQVIGRGRGRSGGGHVGSIAGRRDS